MVCKVIQCPQQPHLVMSKPLLLLERLLLESRVAESVVDKSVGVRVVVVSTSEKSAITFQNIAPL